MDGIQNMDSCIQRSRFFSYIIRIAILCAKVWAQCVTLKILVSECTYICFWDSAMAIDDSLLNSETDGRKEVMTPFQWYQLFS